MPRDKFELEAFAQVFQNVKKNYQGEAAFDNRALHNLYSEKSIFIRMVISNYTSFKLGSRR